ncbi:MAG: butyrate kinase [Bacteroidetes bacterium CG18_big_fil_WC_8_21_14_2_50_41_14]|nr:MAG: butyrate kinase [Bacteroidetes bacterium CG18_big_fil_WC_8_21_14_2_50_41_14]PIY34475.1 MAG: butyrate kinase [Bacteroidetes bacterium CG_4_10_14_3_um_filter_42_6]PJB58515.1 MAG: butyrate kinase [Bacteroidetes bacterium CG_4_9_14_3_um_filter_41_19]
MIYKNILVIYPEVKVTKLAVYRNTEPIFLKTIKHLPEELAQFDKVGDQKGFRLKAIMSELEKNNINLENIELVMGRSGMVKPVSQGVYLINENMVNDLEQGVMGVHATNLGGILAFEIASTIGKKAYMANPVVVDELSDVARVTGHPLFKRKSIFHALNHKHVASKYAKSVNKPYEDLNLIVCHIGSGGISIGAHEKGRVVDVNQAFDGGGPFSITRTGTLPIGQLVELCFSGKYTKEEIMEMITSKGGYMAYLGTDSITEINARIADGDEKAKFISYALSYQVSKEIASHVATLSGKVDAIILTGMIFDSDTFLENVKNRIGHIAPIALYPSVNDFEALALFGLHVLKDEIPVKEYK